MVAIISINKVHRVQLIAHQVHFKEGLKKEQILGKELILSRIDTNNNMTFPKVTMKAHHKTIFK